MKIPAMRLFACSLLVLLHALMHPLVFAIVPTPAADQMQPIAIVGAIIHVGDGQVINDGIITFNEGVITAIGSSSDNINTSGHLIIELQGQHVYPGFVLPNTTVGLLEVDSIRATDDVVEEGDINASVRAAIAYNTDSELIPTHRFNGILTAQITPEGGLVSGSSSVMKLDGWNWEDAVLKTDDGMHLRWPALQIRRRNSETGLLETVDNEDYDGHIQVLNSLFQNAQTYSGSPRNLNLAAMKPVLDGTATLFIHTDEAKEIISAVRFARQYGVSRIVLVGGSEALLVQDFLSAEDIPVIYEQVHALLGMEWSDVDAPFKMPFLLHDAGIKVGIGGGAT